MIDDKQVKVQVNTLGEIVVKMTMPKAFIDEINNVYDENKKSTLDWTEKLAGKIKEENLVNHLMNDNLRGTFQMCFQEYLNRSGLVIAKTHQTVLDNVWINDMKANEYNPFHFHMSPMSDVGLSSVLMLNRPSTYGKEYSREDRPTNGCLDFTGGQQDPLSIPQIRFDAKVGELYVFPYTVLHGVYPFNGTDEIRRTLSYNCNLHKPATVQQVKDNNNA